MTDFKEIPIKAPGKPCPIYPFPDPQKRFIGEFLVRYINGDEWELVYDFGYITDAGEICTARAGFRFDFASVPGILGWLYPKVGDGQAYGIGALFHDWLYCHRKIGGRPIKRMEADDLFYEINRYVGVSWWTASRMYRAVRMFGWIPWGRRKPEDIIP